MTTRKLRSLRTVTQTQDDTCGRPSLLICCRISSSHFPMYLFVLLLPTLDTQHSSRARVPRSPQLIYSVTRPSLPWVPGKCPTARGLRRLLAGSWGWELLISTDGRRELEPLHCPADGVESHRAGHLSPILVSEPRSHVFAPARLRNLPTSGLPKVRISGQVVRPVDI